MLCILTLPEPVIHSAIFLRFNTHILVDNLIWVLAAQLSNQAVIFDEHTVRDMYAYRLIVFVYLIEAM